MPDQEAMSPVKESTLESELKVTEGHLVRAHRIIDRMMPRDDAPKADSTVGVLSASARINGDLNSLCDRLESVADRVGLL